VDLIERMRLQSAPREAGAIAKPAYEKASATAADDLEEDAVQPTPCFTS
jgi:hypothetical protein